MKWTPMISKYLCEFDEDTNCFIERKDGEWTIEGLTIGYTDVAIISRDQEKIRGSLEEIQTICENAWRWAREKYSEEYFKNEANALTTYVLD